MHHPSSRRRCRRATSAAVVVGCVLVTATSASADTRVAIEAGDFGSGIDGGRVLTVQDQRDVFHDERLLVRVTRLSTGRFQVVDSEREAVAGNGCRREAASVVTCNSTLLDGIFFEGSKLGDRLDNDTNVRSRMEGRAGNDILDGGDAGDTLLGEAGNDSLSGQLGVDTALYGAGAGGPIVVTIDGLNNDGTAAENDDVRTDTENVSGTPFSDTIIGSPGANVLTGGGGDDRIAGLGGNDTLNEGGALSGGDDLDGGDGTDTVTYLGRAAGVNVLLNGLADDGNSVDDDAAGGGSAPGDNVRNVENVTGSDRGDTIHGDDAANTIDANGGVDSVQGLGGPDTINGGRDRDILEGGDGDDAINGASAASIEVEDDVLLGGEGNDSLSGQGGSDTMSGDGGNDFMDGGNGDDALDGGPGGDFHLGNAGFDTVDYGARTLPVHLTLGDVNGDDGDATDGPPGQRDTLALVDSVRTGSADDVIRGNASPETIDPGPGRDTVLAAGGGDRLNTNDGVADEISCGEDDVLPDPDDFLTADLADILDPGNQQRLAECEVISAAAVGQLPTIRIATERLRITASPRARIRLHCPAAVNTPGCAGRLTVSHPGDGKPLAARGYRLGKGTRKVIVLRLSREDVRWLERSRKAVVTASETDPNGRPKVSVREIRVAIRGD